MNFSTKIEDFSKEVKDIDDEIKVLYEQANELSDKKIKLMDNFLKLNGKFIKSGEQTYIHVNSSLIRRGKISFQDSVVEIFGEIFSWNDSPYLEKRNFRYECNGFIDIKLCEFDKVNEITKEEYILAFEKMINDLKNTHKKLIE